MSDSERFDFTMLGFFVGLFVGVVLGAVLR
jgi:uncharacterized transporter YbjL